MSRRIEASENNLPVVFIHLDIDGTLRHKDQDRYHGNFLIWQSGMRKLREKYKGKVNIQFRVLTRRAKISEDSILISQQLGLRNIDNKTGETTERCSFGHHFSEIYIRNSIDEQPLPPNSYIWTKTNPPKLYATNSSASAIYLKRDSKLLTVLNQFNTKDSVQDFFRDNKNVEKREHFKAVHDATLLSQSHCRLKEKNFWEMDSFSEEYEIDHGGIYLKGEKENYHDIKEIPPFHFATVASKGAVMAAAEREEWHKERGVLASILVDDEKNSHFKYLDEKHQKNFIHFPDLQGKTDGAEKQLVRGIFDTIDKRIEQTIEVEEKRLIRDGCCLFARKKIDELKQLIEAKSPLHQAVNKIEVWVEGITEVEIETIDLVWLKIRCKKIADGLEKIRDEFIGKEDNSFIRFLQDFGVSLVVDEKKEDNNSQEYKKNILKYIRDKQDILAGLSIGESLRIPESDSLLPYDIEITHTEKGWALDVMLKETPRIGTYKTVTDSLRFINGQWLDYTNATVINDEENPDKTKDVVKESKISQNINSNHVLQLEPAAEFEDNEDEKQKQSFNSERATGSLHELINSKEGPPKEFFNMFLLCYTAALGLQDTHRSNYLHKDVKPPNILYFKQGNFYFSKVCDYGSAEESYSLTSVIDILLMEYTPEYLSPELSKAITTGGSSVKFSDKDDVSSLAITLLELCESWLKRFGNKEEQEIVEAKNLVLILKESFSQLLTKSGKVRFDSTDFIRFFDTLLEAEFPGKKMVKLFLHGQKLVKNLQTFLEEIELLINVDGDNRDYLKNLKSELLCRKAHFDNLFDQLIQTDCLENNSELIKNYQNSFHSLKSLVEAEKRNLVNKIEHKSEKIDFIRKFLNYRENIQAEVKSGLTTNNSFCGFFAKLSAARQKPVKKAVVEKLYRYFKYGEKPDLTPLEVEATQNGQLEKIIDIAKKIDLLPPGLQETQAEITSVFALS